MPRTTCVYCGGPSKSFSKDGETMYYRLCWTCKTAGKPPYGASQCVHVDESGARCQAEVEDVYARYRDRPVRLNTCEDHAVAAGNGPWTKCLSKGCPSNHAAGAKYCATCHRKMMATREAPPFRTRCRTCGGWLCAFRVKWRQDNDHCEREYHAKCDADSPALDRWFQYASLTSIESTFAASGAQLAKGYVVAWARFYNQESLRTRMNRLGIYPMTDDDWIALATRLWEELASQAWPLIEHPLVTPYLRQRSSPLPPQAGSLL